MPYNTRRKSLSLPALGIQLPSTSRAHAHRPSLSKTIAAATAATAAAATTASSTQSNDDADSKATQQQHPAKRLKRAHHSKSPSPLSSPAAAASAPPTTKTVTFVDRPKSSGRNAYEHTPPPSPGASHDRKIDMESINDDIVSGVIEQLEKTGNRPHLIKELATVLSTTNDSVASSANPAALLSSRLAGFIRRPWTALAPCPVAKELIPVHPRKVFYYLTTTPRQELPSSPIEMMPPVVGRGKSTPKRIISPSLSNASSQDDDDDDASVAEERKRAALSPSPEIDLELDLDYSSSQGHAAGSAPPDFPTPGSNLGSTRGSIASDGNDAERNLGLNLRAESPPLESDEREFTNTAHGMRMRGFAAAVSNDDMEGGAGVAGGLLQMGGGAGAVGKSGLASEIEVGAVVEESEEERAKRNSEAAATLFGAHHSHHAHAQAQADADGNAMVLSSPIFKPMLSINSSSSSSAGALPFPSLPSPLPQSMSNNHDHHQQQQQHYSLSSSSTTTTASVTTSTTTTTTTQVHTVEQDLDVVMADEASASEVAGGSILGEAGLFGFGWEIGRPENVCLDLLDDLFDGF